jgi:glycosyltransferase involved in cell wall biosynthesis
MRLLYITNQVCGSGGLERVLSIKASYLADIFGYEVHFLTLNQNKQPLFFDFSSKILHHDIVVNGSAINYLKKYIFGIKKTLKTVNPDIIIVCDDGLKGFFLPTILGKNIPIIYERHVSKNILWNENDTNFQVVKSKLSYLLMNVLAKTFEKFVVLTHDNKAEWNSNNIEVIPNPLTFYPNESSTLLNKTVIAVGKQCYQKGYERLLESWQIVIKKHPDWILKIYGKKDPNQGLEQLVYELKIQDSVQFFDADKDIKERFLEASIFVLSSRYEGFGMVIIEAMACGLPVVSFDCPCGPKDIIENEVDGFLVENGNGANFARKIIFLIENQNIRNDFGTTAKQNVKRFLPEIVLKKWDNLFKELAK